MPYSNDNTLPRPRPIPEMKLRNEPSEIKQTHIFVCCAAKNLRGGPNHTRSDTGNGSIKARRATFSHALCQRTMPRLKNCHDRIKTKTKNLKELLDPVKTTRKKMMFNAWTMKPTQKMKYHQ